MNVTLTPQTNKLFELEKSEAKRRLHRYGYMMTAEMQPKTPEEFEALAKKVNEAALKVHHHFCEQAEKEPPQIEITTWPATGSIRADFIFSYNKPEDCDTWGAAEQFFLHLLGNDNKVELLPSASGKEMQKQRLSYWLTDTLVSQEQEELAIPQSIPSRQHDNRRVRYPLRMPGKVNIKIRPIDLKRDHAAQNEEIFNAADSVAEITITPNPGRHDAYQRLQADNSDELERAMDYNLHTSHRYDVAGDAEVQVTQALGADSRSHPVLKPGRLKIIGEYEQIRKLANIECLHMRGEVKIVENLVNPEEIGKARPINPGREGRA